MTHGSATTVEARDLITIRSGSSGQEPIHSAQTPERIDSAPGSHTGPRIPGLKHLATARTCAGSESRWGVSLVWQVAMLTLSGVMMVVSVRWLKFGADFRGDLYIAGARILHGVSPYNVAQLRHEAAVFAAGGTLHPVVSPRWPAPVLLLAVPFALLPVKAAEILFMLILVASMMAALRLLEVRDPRCVLVALVCTPTVNGVMLGNITPMILLGAALAWRFRARHLTSTTISAVVVVAKLFLWPLAVWLLAARGRRSMLTCIAAGVLTGLLGWMVIGFAGLTSYPSMILDVAKIGEPRGLSLVAFLMYLGLGVGPARFLAFTAAFALLLISWKLARRGHHDNAFGVVFIAVLSATPVVWDHYMILLFIPIALLSPRISWLWFLPGLAAFAPAAATTTYGLRILPMLAGEALLTVLLCEPLIPEAVARYWRSIVATARAAAPS
jgi:hypothetical protein